MSQTIEDESSRKRVRGAAQAALVLVLVVPALLLWTWSRPYTAPPREMPPLTLSPGGVRAELAADARLAALAPDSEAARARRRLYQEANVAEREARDHPGRARERGTRIAAALDGLIEEHGEEVVAQIRAQDVARGEQALAGELAAGDSVSELGGFVPMMERYGMAADGIQIAPRFVVRTAFAGRWNALHARELTDGFSELERRAYWGWLALHALEAPAALRMEALGHYEAVAGERADEARGMLLYGAGDIAGAHEAFLAAYEARGTFRLRNHALAAVGTEGGGDDDPP